MDYTVRVVDFDCTQSGPRILIRITGWVPQASTARSVEERWAKYSVQWDKADDEALAWYLQDYVSFDPFSEGKVKLAKECLARLHRGLANSLLLDKKEEVYPGLSRLTVVVEVDALQGIPWETLEATNNTAWIDENSPLKGFGCTLRRSLHLRKPPSCVLKMPFRILMVVSRPDGRRDIDFRNASLALCEIVKGLPSHAIQLDFVRPGAYWALEDTLVAATAKYGKGYYSLVHLDLHGIITKKCAFLRFSKCDGSFSKSSRAHIAATRVAELLQQHDVPIVFLNACKSARGARADMNIARLFLEHGAQNVVGMSFDAHATMAKLFLTAFYDSLLRRRCSVPEAFHEGRKSLIDNKLREGRFGKVVEVDDWVVPILYEHAEASAECLRLLDNPMEVDTDKKLASNHEKQAIGRDFDILVIEEMLLTRSPFVWLSGFPGVGKASFIDSTTNWWSDTGFVDQVVCFDFRESLALSLSQSDLCRGIQQVLENLSSHSAHSIVTVSPSAIIEGELLKGPRTREQQTPMAGEAEARQKVLLVLQNVHHVLRNDESWQVALSGLIQRFLSSSTGNRLLCTSACDDIPACFSRGKQGQHDIANYRLTGLDSTSATKLAARLLGPKLEEFISNDLNRAYFDVILEHFQRNPLAIEVLCNRLKTATRPHNNLVVLYEELLRNIWPTAQDLTFVDPKPCLVDFEDRDIAMLLIRKTRPSFTAAFHTLLYIHNKVPREILHPIISGTPVDVIQDDSIDTTIDSVFQTLAKYGMARILPGADITRDTVVLHPLLNFCTCGAESHLLADKEIRDVVINPMLPISYLESSRPRDLFRICMNDRETAKGILKDEWPTLATMLLYLVHKPFNMPDSQVESCFETIFLLAEMFALISDNAPYLHLLGRVSYFGIERLRSYYSPLDFNEDNWWESLALERYEGGDSSAQRNEVSVAAVSDQQMTAQLRSNHTRSNQERQRGKGEYVLTTFDFIRLLTLVRMCKRAASFYSEDAWMWNERLFRLFEYAGRHGHVGPWPQPYLNVWRADAAISTIEKSIISRTRLQESAELAFEIKLDTFEPLGDSRKDLEDRLTNARIRIFSVIQEEPIDPDLKFAREKKDTTMFSNLDDVDKRKHWLVQALSALRTTPPDKASLDQAKGGLLDCLQKSIHIASVSDQWFTRWYLAAILREEGDFAGALGHLEAQEELKDGNLIGFLTRHPDMVAKREGRFVDLYTKLGMTAAAEHHRWMQDRVGKEVEVTQKLRKQIQEHLEANEEHSGGSISNGEMMEMSVLLDHICRMEHMEAGEPPSPKDVT